MITFLVSFALLAGTVAVLGGWAMRKERRLRAEAVAVAGADARAVTQANGKERDAGHHRQRA